MALQFTVILPVTKKRRNAQPGYLSPTPDRELRSRSNSSKAIDPKKLLLDGVRLGKPRWASARTIRQAQETVRSGAFPESRGLFP